MKSFTAFYNIGVTDDLMQPRGDQEEANNARILQERLEANWKQIEAAKVLEGLVVHNRQECIGSLSVSGPDENIDRLKAFLEEKNLGAVVQSQTVMKGAEKM
jgi:hypothetical protein